MADTDLEGLIGPALAGAITKKGYTTLTPVQEAVLDPALEGRDLRISSQTGSGKTVAIGLTLRAVIEGDVASSPKGAARPRALVVAPTRELAKQVETELSWLFAPLRVKVASVTGGGDFRDERRALGAGPAIVVGTPGRLLDHLTRGSVDGTQLGAVVLDEADRMLDLGFREDLEAILGFAPAGHRTHLVSATFPREVTALANRVQTDPARIEGTPLGTANTDIEHLVHLVLPNERLDAIVNLLLETPEGTTLIFARTRADVGELTHLLGEAGFTVDSLSGEMEQRERNKARAAFKRGDLDALVATDVAARGIDVQDIARVLHAEPPSDVDAYTHRSGRTGRAGRQGKSSVLVTPPALNKVSSLLNRAKVRWRFEPVPTAVSIESAREQRLYERLTTVAPPVDPAEDVVVDPAAPQEADERSWALAKRITEAGEATRALARMIARTRASGPEARRISVITPPPSRKPRPWEEQRDTRSEPRHDPRADRAFVPGDFARNAPRDGAEQAGREGRAFGEAPRGYGEARGLRPDRGPMGDGGQARSPRDPETDAGAWTTFRVSWGQIHGADARRLLAMVCRRGGIRGSDVGAIRVARTFSTVAVSGAAATAFEKATREPDPRDPKVRIRVEGAGGEAEERGDDRAPERPKSVRELPAERKSTKSVKELPSDRASVKSVKDLPSDRASAKSVKELPSDRKSVKDLPSDRASVKSVKELP
ncbi:MAG TPA: DEAD/DEAH box helicase, partial [Labilithrix sp.]|nr:DEAD/DEAH box helicase [Labilithrix sp.]